MSDRVSLAVRRASAKASRDAPASGPIIDRKFRYAVGRLLSKTTKGPDFESCSGRSSLIGGVGLTASGERLRENAAHSFAVFENMALHPLNAASYKQIQDARATYSYPANR